jgi:hypothetical protein
MRDVRPLLFSSFVDGISLMSLIFTVAASGLSIVAKQIIVRRQKKERATVTEGVGPSSAWRIPAGIGVLLTFAGIIIIFGGFSVYHYWPLISSNSETLMFALWLFFAMVAGMFVQVLAANYRGGRPLFDVSASQLVFPLLFALIVYYPIWALAASSPHNLFSFYAAFLNGYFWESVVSAAKAPTPNPNPPL